MCQSSFLVYVSLTPRTDYIIWRLPDSLLETSTNITADPLLLSIYSQLPFPLLKKCLESPDLPFNSMKDRFAFAKRVIGHRKSLNKAAQTPNGMVPMDEAAVLAFAGAGEMQVHVTRKPKRGKTQLWKVES